MGDDKMTERSQHALAICSGWQFSSGKLLRTLVGAAAVVAVAAYVHYLHRHTRWPAYYVSGTEFAITALFSAIVGYLICRCFFGRFTSLLTGMASAGAVGSLFLWRKGDDMREFTILGMLVACSLFVAIGWLDRRKEPFLKRISLWWSKRKSKGDTIDQEKGDEG
jgi:hypothetical protein